jgi:large subunit ribosomal protein L30
MRTILRIKQLRSLIGSSKKIRLITAHLGLNKIGSVNFIVDSPSSRGMIKRVQHIISVKRYRLQ